MMTTEENIKLKINVGPLTSFGSLVYHIGPSLIKFSEEYQKGNIYEVEWDLSDLDVGHINMATLTSFLSVAYRLRKFVGYAPFVRIRWIPGLLKFLDGVSFFKISKQLDLFSWDEAMIGGYDSENINPYNSILVFDDIAPNKDNIELWKDWKDEKREESFKELLKKGGGIFISKKGYEEFGDNFIDKIFFITAELIVNAILHGKETAFVGLQRTGAGITVAVADSGRGFPISIHEEYKLSNKVKPLEHINALFFGSILKESDIGLRGIIGDVLDKNGWVIMSSFNAKIFWNKELFDKCINSKLLNVKNPFSFQNLIPIVGSPINRELTKKDWNNGYYNVWKTYLRGTRITFEIPLTEI